MTFPVLISPLPTLFTLVFVIPPLLGSCYAFLILLVFSKLLSYFTSMLFVHLPSNFCSILLSYYPSLPHPFSILLHFSYLLSFHLNLKLKYLQSLSVLCIENEGNIQFFLKNWKCFLFLFEHSTIVNTLNN